MGIDSPSMGIHENGMEVQGNRFSIDGNSWEIDSHQWDHGKSILIDGDPWELNPGYLKRLRDKHELTKPCKVVNWYKNMKYC